MLTIFLSVWSSLTICQRCKASLKDFNLGDINIRYIYINVTNDKNNV